MNETQQAKHATESSDECASAGAGGGEGTGEGIEAVCVHNLTLQSRLSAAVEAELQVGAESPSSVVMRLSDSVPQNE
jgi:hypothetical protein